MSTMIKQPKRDRAPDSAATELLVLKERVAEQPARVRRELEPLIDELIEHAHFRSQVMLIARQALERLRLELAVARFDLEATRGERDLLKR